MLYNVKYISNDNVWTDTIKIVSAGTVSDAEKIGDKLKDAGYYVLEAEEISHDDIVSGIGGFVGYIEEMRTFGIHTAIADTPDSFANRLKIYEEYTEAMDRYLEDRYGKETEVKEILQSIWNILLDIGELRHIFSDLNLDEYDIKGQVRAFSQFHESVNQTWKLYREYALR